MNNRWRPLPASLDNEIVYLVEQLRELKDRSGLSLTQLGAKTAYSKSSWARYLNGAKLPPRHAVEALAELTGEPVDRLVALWERAESRWSKNVSSPSAPTTTPEPAASEQDQLPAPAARRPGTRLQRVVLLTTGFAALASLVLLVVLGDSSPPADSSAPAAPLPPMIGCHRLQCTNQEPEDMGCDSDPASYADLQVDTAYVELRISDLCAAGWARISQSTVGDRIEVVNRNGYVENATVADADSTIQYVHTPMIAADQHSQLRACIKRRNGLHQCTSWGAQNPLPPRAPTAHTP